METIEMIGVAAVGGMFLFGLGMRLYQRFRPMVEEALEDGELSLSEALEIAEEVKETIEELRELPSLSAMKKMRKAELVELAESQGVDMEGTKQEIIDRLREAMD